MSVQAFYRVQCSGACGRWLSTGSVPKGPRPVDDVSAAAVFSTWAAADETAARAGWHDGSQGQFAVCDCGARAEAVLVPIERREKPQHKDTCRKTHPRLVPLCPACRAQT